MEQYTSERVQNVRPAKVFCFCSRAEEDFKQYKTSQLFTGQEAFKMFNLFREADTKYVKRPKGTSKTKIKPLDTYKFKLCPLLKGIWKLRKDQAAIRYRATPDTLVELSSSVVNAIPLPQPRNWTTNDVADWIRKLGFPQYQNTFKKNYVNGRTLLRMDASYLIKINIKDFDHIRIITNSIRKLYGFERSKWGRSISLPPRDPGPTYKFFRMRNGPYYDLTRRTDLFRMRHMLRPPPLYETHWQTLERWLKHQRPVDPELIGGTIQKRYNLYYPKKGKPPPPPRQQNIPDCHCLPPCTCQWTIEKELRQPWHLRCLNIPVDIAMLSPLSLSCKCVPPCACGWKTKPRETLSILMKNIPNKFDVHNKERNGPDGYKLYLGAGGDDDNNQIHEIFLNSIETK